MFKSFLESQSNTNLVGILCVLIATVGLSVKAIFIKLVYLADPQIDAISILTIRFFLALPFFLLLLIYVNKNAPAIKFQRTDIFTYFLLGVMGFYVSAILDFSALAYIPAGLERLILFLYPTFVVLISFFIRPKEVTRQIIYALVISYIGVVIVFIDQAPHMTPTLIKGSLLVFGAAITFAVYTVASVRPIKAHGSIRFTAYAMFAASGATLAHSFGVHGISVFDRSFEVYMYVLPMAIISTVLPLILMAEGVKRIGASSSSIIATTGPIITISLAYIILGEAFGLVQGIGGAMIIAGVFFVARKKPA